MAETYVESLKDKQKIKDQLGTRDTVYISLSKRKTEQLNLYNVRVRVKERTLGTAFILGHSVNGLLGTQSPQPVLGTGTMNAWKIISETSGPEKITDAGIAHMISFLKGDSPNYFDYIAYGTGTTDFAVTQTTLVTETKRIQAFVGDIGTA